MSGRRVTGSANPVTVTVARTVAPGREEEFEDWAERLNTAASRFTGFLGAGLLRPGAVGEPWHVVYRFDTPAHLAAWERSSARQEHLAAGEDLMRTTGTHKVSGLETWFAVPGRTAPAPPRWKMFLVSLAGIYGLQLVLYAIFGGATTGWPLPLRLGVFVPVVTALMTWVVMPRLAVALQSWLYAPRRRR